MKVRNSINSRGDLAWNRLTRITKRLPLTDLAEGAGFCSK